ncbi:MAG TPA: hypothetical protein VHV55_19190 [Pirellulales bacterium]|nr:hypothetical protein [Pirellulales bacterium]
MFARLSTAVIVGVVGIWAAENSLAGEPRVATNPYAASASTAPTHTAIYRRVKGGNEPSPFKLTRMYYGYGQYHPWLYRPRYYFPYASYPYGVGFGYPYGGLYGYAFRPYYQSYAYPYNYNYGYGWPAMYSSFYWPGAGYPFGGGGSFGPWGGVGYSPYYAGYGGYGGSGAYYGGYGGYGGCYYW